MRVGGSSFQGNLTFAESEADTLNLDLTAKDYRQVTLVAQPDSGVTAGNYSFEVSLDFSQYST